MSEWEWDEMGHFWFKRKMSEEMTPQQLMDKYKAVLRELRMIGGEVNRVHYHIKELWEQDDE